MTCPTDSYIKYLQAHPAVWEALQEGWVVGTGDWYTDGKQVKVVGSYDDWKDVSAMRLHPKADIRWLPDLGQLVRMIGDTGERWSVSKLCFGYSKDPTEQYIATTISKPMGAHGEEPEIACTALWAKVKGVE